MPAAQAQAPVANAAALADAQETAQGAGFFAVIYANLRLHQTYLSEEGK